MKILIINSVCGAGSTGRMVTDLYKRITNEGHECCIAFGRGKASEEYYSYKIGNTLNVLEHVLETRLFDNHGFSSRLATIKLVDFIQNYKPDIIHMHNLHGYYLNIEILFDYLRKTTIKLVWTMHDTWIISGHKASIDWNEDGTLQHLVENKRDLKEYPQSYFLNRSLRNYNKKKDIMERVSDCEIVTPSNWLKNIMEHSFMSKFNIKKINNGIDLEAFYAKDNNSLTNDTSKKIILGVANFFSKSKGIEILNELADILPNDYQVVVIGKVDDVDINKNIFHIQQTDNIAELAEWYSKALVYVNPTFADNFPTTNIEALACGTPVITFNTGGSPEIIEADNGVVTKEKTAFSIKDAIHSVEQSNTITKDSCIKTSKKYNTKIMTQAYLNMYENIMN